MLPRQLRNLKAEPKRLDAIPAFRGFKKGGLPPPFHKYKSKRLETTGMVDIATGFALIFFWRDGPTLTDRAFYGHFFRRMHGGAITPLFEFHWHPAHKGFHCKLPCNTKDDYTNRMLPGAPELELRTNALLDPRDSADRLQLIMLVCCLCGIELPSADPTTKPLFTNRP